MKNIYLKKVFCGALAAGVAIAGLNAPVQTDAKTTTKKSIDNMSVMSRVVSKNNDGLLRYSYVDENGKKIDFNGSSASLPSTRKKATSVPSSYDIFQEPLILLHSPVESPHREGFPLPQAPSLH